MLTLRLQDITNTLAGWWYASEELMAPLQPGDQHFFELGASPLGPLTGLIQAAYPVTMEHETTISYGSAGSLKVGGGERTSSHLDIWTTAYVGTGKELHRITMQDERSALLRPLLMQWIEGTALQILRMNGRDVPEHLELQDSKQCETCPSWGRMQCHCREYVTIIGDVQLEYGGGIGGTMGEHPSW